MKIDTIPIKWFGDRKAYQKSEVKIITVGLNPSDKEFREKDGQPFSTTLRFPRYRKDAPNTLTLALNDYFKTNPYRWFNAFENVLNGMDASYYDKQEFPYRALHTDICSPWATAPTWSKLPKSETEAMFEEGHPQWLRLIAKLKPNIIVASLATEYIANLHIAHTQTKFCQFDYKKDDTKRNRPEIVWKYDFNGIPLINGCTHNIPFGRLSTEFKQEVGRKIIERLL